MSLELKNNPTLKDFQQYVLQMKRERGFNTTDKFYECCLLAEECGEVISAVRKNSKSGSVASDSVAGNVAEELADVFIYVCSLANMHGIDLERAFREKEEKKQTPHLEKALKTQTPAGIFKPNRQRHRNFRPHVFPLFF